VRPESVDMIGFFRVINWDQMLILKGIKKSESVVGVGFEGLSF